MNILILILGILGLAASAMPIVLAYRFKKHIAADLRSPAALHAPKASVIIPCKGLDPDFKTNITALFNQDYREFQLIFVTAEDNDPAYPELRRLIQEHPNVSARLEVAGVAQGRSQKVNNQLRGLEVVDPDSEILVFLDSDARPETDFLQRIVQPLEEPGVGLSTGFRWYLPVKGGLWSYLRSAWNGGGVVFLTDPRANYAWGGAMAIRRSVFHECKIPEIWRTALSDDMTITLAVREHGLKIRFVPHCLVAIHEDCNFSEMLEWTNRQTIITRIYHPALWRTIALAHGMGNAILCLGAILVLAFVLGFVRDPLILTGAILMLAMAPMEMIGGYVLLPAVERMLPQYGTRIRGMAWKYLLLAPPASMLALANTIHSLFTNRITWRGVTYEMRSSTETIVVHHKKD
ncbi:Glycosyltransferase, catalytic subunit of cellulose synthase and poly-beta-1,6-N-acetylglucosamine synthase [Desulfonatronum thiosulfatophilum]|uniref:Glycosyltransferase, catalytic subunit of cellulose synthase and poly-beta-1,6-N-acetylglucosamine synthase n=1 Tax=Desulfonatronum thiosulfatophilum TaxID=617002 RepID=A0A1G6EN97_9BACT|nr:glycosyltransferase [Desulfonatronum thiosulfatophilum]SDB58355.1 Glycosyltransferase, catalytic subunit of cellulose synthase and poly-beta-1,6-N-acetylglucosamine synthase [Desulfonatronum thiosulfatophilum]